MKPVIAAAALGLLVGGLAGLIARPEQPNRCMEERQRAAAALAALHPDRKITQTEARPAAPELGPSWQEEAVKGQLLGVTSRTGASLARLDCAELPCLAALRFPDSESVQQAPQAINLSFTEPIMSAFVLANFAPSGQTETVPWMFMALAPADLDERYLNQVRERMRVFRDDVKRSEGAL